MPSLAHRNVYAIEADIRGEFGQFFPLQKLKMLGEIVTFSVRCVCGSALVAEQCCAGGQKARREIPRCIGITPTINDTPCRFPGSDPRRHPGP